MRVGQAFTEARDDGHHLIIEKEPNDIELRLGLDEIDDAVRYMASVDRSSWTFKGSCTSNVQLL